MTQDDLKQKALQVEEDHRRGVKKRDGYTENMLLYYEYVSKGSCKSDEHSYAFSLNEDDIQREIVEALLLADAKPADVEELFGITEIVLGIYEELFFAMSAFRTKLDKISYITNYKETEGRELKVRALNLGPEFIYFKYANLIPKSESQRRIVKHMFMVAAYRAMEANYNPMNSNISKAALQWSQTMIKSYEAIEKLMTEDVSDANDLVKIITSRELAPRQKIEDDEVIE